MKLFKNNWGQRLPFPLFVPPVSICCQSVLLYKTKPSNNGLPHSPSKLASATRQRWRCEPMIASYKAWPPCLHLHLDHRAEMYKNIIRPWDVSGKLYKEKSFRKQTSDPAVIPGEDHSHGVFQPLPPAAVVLQVWALCTAFGTGTATCFTPVDMTHLFGLVFSHSKWDGSSTSALILPFLCSPSGILSACLMRLPFQIRWQRPLNETQVSAVTPTSCRK